MEMNERIQKIRKALGLSQEQFAYGLKMSASRFADYESGRCCPSEGILELIQIVYGVSGDWLATGTGRMFVQETDNKNLRWFMLWDAGGKHDPSHLWLVDKVTGFSDLKVELLADIASAMI